MVISLSVAPKRLLMLIRPLCNIKHNIRLMYVFFSFFSKHTTRFCVFKQKNIVSNRLRLRERRSAMQLDHLLQAPLTLLQPLLHMQPTYASPSSAFSPLTNLKETLNIRSRRIILTVFLFLKKGNRGRRNKRDHFLLELRWYYTTRCASLKTSNLVPYDMKG